LDKLVDIFSTGIHRVAIIDDDENILFTISQSFVINLIYLNWDKFNKEFGNTKCSKFELGTTKPYIVNENDHIFNAIQIIKETKVSALPVINNDGVLVANFSASDLK
jgi:CBS domain-containing protein